MDFPGTEVEAHRLLSTPEAGHELFVSLRWPSGVCCPHCGSLRVGYLKAQRRWKCYEGHARPQFSAKTGTIFEDSPITLDLWMLAVWKIVNTKNGITSVKLAKDLGVSQKTAWFMDHRIRLALRAGSFEMIEGGEVEIDETFVGGKGRNMHLAKRREVFQGRGTVHKTPVMGMLSRSSGRVVAMVVGDISTRTLQGAIFRFVAAGTSIFTDGHSGYRQLPRLLYRHKTVDHHRGQYVDGRAHTNSIESFWNLLKRTLRTYIQVSRRHLWRYVDEQVFRFNTRKLTDGERFVQAVDQTIGCRTTYAEVTKR